MELYRTSKVEIDRSNRPQTIEWIFDHITVDSGRWTEVLPRAAESFCGPLYEVVVGYSIVEDIDMWSTMRSHSQDSSFIIQEQFDGWRIANSVRSTSTTDINTSPAPARGIKDYKVNHSVSLSIPTEKRYSIYKLAASTVTFILYRSLFCFFFLAWPDQHSRVHLYVLGNKHQRDTLQYLQINDMVSGDRHKISFF